jgi:hypothetical protein
MYAVPDGIRRTSDLLRQQAQISRVVESDELRHGFPLFITKNSNKITETRLEV